jgi:hypothetical protein
MLKYNVGADTIKKDFEELRDTDFSIVMDEIALELAMRP